ncbi:PAS domain-containing protein [Halobacterium salinarum]|uniref:Receiver/sensor box protein n=4 Tax=Halobacterium salinarum TaxID=2242 RepID=Q9HP91_HALSA|nr:PAS domain-containing protein [Halobacterium salinarum]AAG19979.1 hypothetical protein VNG_1751H [Halobacterium salinarum NRC-1]MBB6088987.1 PAS domain S-box-containing protein [Halobacterium salinarum]MDL0118623.1 PAS domain-containing protein [Halobacterium salinarum]MDL0124916.1 PAS domain-containing protein [Halobacterium salinarum]MDL0136010.1 PAS domain-containing protein [Halobacterium salinarum]
MDSRTDELDERQAVTDAINVTYVLGSGGGAGERTAARLERVAGDVPIAVTPTTDPMSVSDDAGCVVAETGLHGVDIVSVVARLADADVPVVVVDDPDGSVAAGSAIDAGATAHVRARPDGDTARVLANRVRTAVERRRDRESMSHTERRLRRVIDSLPQCVLEKTLDGEYLLVNDSGASNYGLDPDAVEGHREDEFLPPDLVERFHREDEQVIADDEALHIPEQHVDDRVIGDDRVEEVYKLPFDDPDTDADTVLTVVADVTTAYERRHRLAGAATHIEDAISQMASADPDHDRIRSLLDAAHEYAVGDSERAVDPQ